MSTHRWLAVPIVAAVLLCLGAERPSPQRRTDGRSQRRPVAAFNFDRDPVAKLPEGWKAAETHPGKTPAAWKVVADEAAPSKPNVFGVKTQNTGSTYNLAITEKLQVTDFQIRVRVRADSGDEDQGGGPVWRYKDENNYYICRLNPLESNYRVYKVQDGKRTQLATADVDAEAGKWYTLRAVMIGKHITCYVDGKPLLDVTDETFLKPGQVGLWTKADASTSFDDLQILPPPTTQPATQPTSTAPAAR